MTKLTHAGYRDFLHSNSIDKKEHRMARIAFEESLDKFNQLPDIGAELEATKAENEQLKQVITQVRNRMGKSRSPVFMFAAELDKWIKVETKGILTRISTEKVLNKIKELQGGK